MTDSAGTTTPDGPVQDLLASMEDERRRQDAETLADLMQEVTGEPPVLWGTSIVGFGSRHYAYASGREGDTAAVSFSPRKAHAVLYLSGDVADYADLLAALGPHQVGKACLYLERVDEVDPAVLREIVQRSYRGGQTAS